MNERPARRQWPTVLSGDPADFSDEVLSVFAEWDASGHADTLAVLGRLPHLRLDKDSLLDLAYEEYVRRLAAGEAVDLDAFCARFPDHEVSVRRLVISHNDIEAKADRLDEDKTPFRWPEAGGRVGEYRLLRRLGKGGFARVFLAQEEVADRLVVLKFSTLTHKGEPRTLGRLEHPNVVPIYGARVVDGALLVVAMPYLGGSTLLDLLDVAFGGGRQPPPDALARALGRGRFAGEPTGPALEPRPYARLVLELARELAGGLAYLHGQGIQHRDLKPSNVLLSRQGRPVLLDFNLAADLSCGLNQCGGTLSYMAPEQIRAAFLKDPKAVVDHRSDIYSLGAVLYELLTGRHPFDRPEGRRTPSQHLSLPECGERQLARQRAGAPAVASAHPGLMAVALSCLEFDPQRRPQSARALAEELARLDPARRQARLLRRVLVAAASAAALTAGGFGFHLAARPPLAERAVAAAKADLNAGRPVDAARQLEPVLQPGADHPEGYFLRGLARLRAGQTEAALADFELARRQDYSARGATAAALAYCHALMGNYGAAVTRAETAETHGFVSPALLANRAYCRIKEIGPNDRKYPVAHKQALADLDAAVALDPTFAPAYHVRAFSLMRPPGRRKPTDLEAAITAIEQAAAHRSARAEMYRFGAELLALRRPLGRPALDPVDVERAVRWLNRAVDLGLEPARISTKGPLAVLATEPGFQAVLARPPALLSPSEHEFLVDPLTDITP